MHSKHLLSSCTALWFALPVWFAHVLGSAWLKLASDELAAIELLILFALGSVGLRSDAAVQLAL